MSSALFKRLDLKGADGQKYDQLLEGVLDVEKLPDPTGKNHVNFHIQAIRCSL